MRKVFLFFIAVCSLCVVSTSHVSAAEQQDALNLTISPVTLQLSTTPGVSVSAPVKVRNNARSAETLHISMLTFTPDASGEKPILKDPTAQDAFMSWFSVSEDRFTIQPSEWKTVTVTFAPPKEASLLYSYAVVIGRDQVTPVQGSAVISGSAALMVLANVESPNTVRELSVPVFHLPRIVSEFLPVEFETEIKNTGNSYIVPHGNIFIDGQGKKDLAVLPLNPNGLAVLPDTTRTLHVAWDDGFPVKNEQGKLTFDWSRVSHLRIGRYTAHLLLVYDNGAHDVPIESSVTFWVIPVRLVLGVIAIPLLPALLVFFLMQLRLKRVMQRAKESV